MSGGLLRHPALSASLRNAAIMLAFTVVFTAMMAFTYQATRPAILAAEKEEQLRLINEILPPQSYDNTLLEDYLQIAADPPPGLLRNGRIWRARKAGRPVALLVEALSTEAYAGRVVLIVAVRPDGSVAGVRVTSHKETPGLGDYIDPQKDRNKAHPWIDQFARPNAPGKRWRLTKDGGDVDYHVGATVSARAVTNAVDRAVAFAARNRHRLYELPAGETVVEKGGRFGENAHRGENR